VRRLYLLGVLTLGALAIAAPLAGAAYDPLASGATRLTFDKSFLALLKENGVKLSAVAPARFSAGAASFPVSGGKFDPTTSEGTVEHEGALLFSKGARKIPLKDLQLKTTSKHSPLSVKVGGGQLKLAAARSLKVSRRGFGEEVRVSSLSLSAKVAGRLAKKLGLRGVFKEGEPLTSSLTRANSTTITVLPKGRATLSLDPGIVAKLNSLFVAANPIFPAEHQGPVFTLPIAGGTIAPGGTEGTIETAGSLEFLQLGGGQVFWHEPALDLAARVLGAEADTEPSPPYPGKAGRVGLAALIPTAPVVANAGARTVAVSGALTLDSATATAFNEVFAKPQGKDNVFAAGEALGTLSFTAEGQ
jgi:hypothetical protein